ncbi:hypothetical protein BV25DRAFT_396462 [Artomyces pyxidatus]|uniref:Uncharacterized protein n=1 Tax=Artomyces pyxidatus TaxID=48021 RepID=A0ACB8T500_9AGAM|nr:hypothetical protein BV25DRAFT_396462 [Artomyces pyxidatus]
MTLIPSRSRSLFQTAGKPLFLRGRSVPVDWGCQASETHALASSACPVTCPSRPFCLTHLSTLPPSIQLRTAPSPSTTSARRQQHRQQAPAPRDHHRPPCLTLARPSNDAPTAMLRARYHARITAASNQRARPISARRQRHPLCVRDVRTRCPFSSRNARSPLRASMRRARPWREVWAAASAVAQR